MKRLVISTLAISMLFSCNLKHEPAEEKSNCFLIDSTDTPEMIIQKAANIVPTERQYNWQKQELTAFLHFGMNTFTDSEWGDGTENPADFNPTELDAEQWIKTLKETGFKCAILTCKHHDGFCLWPCAGTEHSVKNSPWRDGKGDLVKEVADACRKYEMGFGVYLSPWDRNSLLYGTPEYNDYFVSQLTELLTNYGKVAEVWFDGANGEGPNGKKQEYDFSRWYSLIRQLQPEAVIAVMGPDVRWVGTETGRGRETEWSVVPSANLDQSAIADGSQKNLVIKPEGDLKTQDVGSREKILNAKSLVWYPAETDVSIRPGWFYHSQQDTLVKTPNQLMDIYFTSVGRNGVLLLNIPPDRRGLIADADIESLKGFAELRERVFGQNLMASAKVKEETGEGFAFIQNITLAKPTAFNVLALQEDILQGQRVEKFVLEAKDVEGQWQEVVTGTTIGYKRLLQFDEVTATELRFKVLESRLTPHLVSVSIHKR